MAVEATVLRDEDLSDLVMPYPLEDRLGSQHLVNSTFAPEMPILFSELRNFYPRKYFVGFILSFLQSNLDLSTIKEQILAFTVLFQRH